MQAHNDLHFIDAWKRDVMTEAAAQERIGKLPFGIAGDDDDRPLFGHHLVIDLPDDEGTVFEHIQQIVLSVRIGLVDFIEKQDPPVFRQEGPANGTKAEVIPDVVDVPPAFATAKA
jgi:hypothetical protein